MATHSRRLAAARCTAITLAAAALGAAVPRIAVAQAPAGTPPAAALTASDLDAWLDGYMPYALRTGDIAGAVVVVVKDGQVLSERGYGFSDVATRAPVDPVTTLFRPGSVSKLFTWTAVMQQVEQGKIDLDADVNRYLDFAIPAREGKPITMRNLMQHTPGFEEDAKNEFTANPKAALSNEAWVKEWIPTRIFAAGTTPAYSNYGAALAGYIVQRVSGEPFDDYIDRHLFAPLDMTHSTFRQPLPANLVPLMSKGYQEASGEAKPFEIVGPSPAGSLASSGDDMAHFMIAHLQNGAYHGTQILTPATAHLMHDSPFSFMLPLNRMELGFFETNINGHEVIAHLGDTGYFHTSLHLFLNDSVGFYVSFNSLGKGGAAGSLRTALFEAFADRYFPDGPPPPALDAKTSAAHVRSLAGNWSVSRRAESNFLNILDLFSQIKLGVGPKGDLVAPFPGLNGKPRHWIEYAPYVWRDADSHERFAAKLVNGTPVGVSIDLVSPFMVWQRPPWTKNAAWLLPLFIAGLCALALTVIFWPIRALVRRHYHQPLALEPAPMRAYRLSRYAALAIIVGVLAWAGFTAALTANTTKPGSALDPLLWIVEIVSAIAFLGGLLLMLWNFWVVWSGTRRWPAKTWSVVLAISALSVVWVGLAFKLIHFGVHY